MKWNSKVKLRPLQCCQPLWNHVPGEDNDGWCWGHVEAEWNLKKKNAQLCLPSMWMWIICSNALWARQHQQLCKSHRYCGGPGCAWCSGFASWITLAEQTFFSGKTGEVLWQIQQKKGLHPSKTLEADFQMHPESNYSIIISITAYIFHLCFFQFLPKSTSILFPETACRFFQETLVPQPGLVRLRAPAPAALGNYATGFHVVAAK